MMKRNLLISLGTLLILQGSVYAGHITIESRYSFPDVITGNNFSIDAELRNTGDEAAYGVSLTPRLREGLNTETLFAGNKLDYNTTFSGHFPVNLGDQVVPGEYALTMQVDYKDANGYPFSSISIPPRRLVIKKHSNSLVSGVIDKINLPASGSKDITLKIRNLGDGGHKVKITLLLPRELDASQTETNLSLNPKEEKKQVFDVSSLGALSGSIYVIYALMEYEEDNLHYTSVATGILNIVEEDEGLSIPGYAYFAVLIIIVLLFIGYQLITRHISTEKKREDEAK